MRTFSRLATVVVLVSALGGATRSRADSVTSVRLAAAEARALARLLDGQTVSYYGRIYRLHDVLEVEADARASEWAFEAALDPLAEVGDAKPHFHADASRGVEWYAIAPQEACGRDAQPLVGDVRRLDLANVLVQRGDRFVWLAEEAPKAVEGLEGQLSIHPPQVVEGASRAWEACAAQLDAAARAFPLASTELYDPSGRKLDIRRSFRAETEIPLDGGDPWRPSRIRLKPRRGGAGAYALQARRHVAIACEERATREDVWHEPWREVPGTDGDFAVTAFFEGALPRDVEAKRATLLAGKSGSCELFVDRVELRILHGTNAIQTLRVTMPRGD